MGWRSITWQKKCTDHTSHVLVPKVWNTNSVGVCNLVQTQGVPTVMYRLGHVAD